ncbi:hypothetical protein ACJZ2D_009277 [Fusarium nematophilum]
MATPESKSHSDGELVQPTTIPYWRLVIDQAGITPEVANYNYPGSGTKDDPYIVQWIPNDPRNPMEFATTRKWFITMSCAIATLAVALVSSAYTGGIAEIIQEFGISREVSILGVSVFVIGFAVGPLIWAPFSEIFGRQIIFIGTYAGLTAFNIACAVAQNAPSLIVFRFLAGAFGSSPLTNAGGTIADMFPASQRGLAMALFAAAPFLGPVLGPVCGGFLGMNAGWRWVMGLLAILSGVLLIFGALVIPETYGPTLLRRRAARLSKTTGQTYISAIDHKQGTPTLGASLQVALLRPWILLFKEPIVLLLSIYMAIIYGTLYMFFAAFPIVYQQGRGWNQGISGLAFLGIMNGGFAPPEARLPPAIVGSFAIPVGLFWFAWTNYPSIHWIVSILAGIPFGFGMVLVFLSVMNYLIDSYTLFAASVLAANSILRSCFGAAFPLFTAQMYENLGIHWASSVPAFLALACVPFPFLLYKFGPRIRAYCKFAAESDAFMRTLRMGHDQPEPEEEKQDEETTEVDNNEDDLTVVDEPVYAPTRSRASSLYEGNPYSIDRVHTRQSFS